MGELIPIFGMMTGIVVVGILGVTLVKVFGSKAGQDMVRKLGGEEEDSASLEALHDRIERLEERLVDTEERLHFAERLLSERSTASPSGEG